MPSLLSRFHTSIKNVRTTLLPSDNAVSEVTFLDMLAHNWHPGFTSFGGPAVHFQIFQQLFVEKYQWIDQTRYQEIFALCQALSGPGSTKMIYAVNVLLYGFWVGLAAFVVWGLPMAIASLGLAMGVGSIDDRLPGPAYALLSGLDSATVGIIALAAVQLSNKAVTDEISRVLVFFRGAVGMLYNSLWYSPALMVVGGVVTCVWDLGLAQRTWKKLRRGDDDGVRKSCESVAVEMRSADAAANNSSVSARNTRATEVGGARNPNAHDEATSILHNEIDASQKISRKKGSLIIAVFLISFLTVMVRRGTLNGHSRGFDLFANFYLAGTIIFGGGPFVIPLLRE